ncbi:hypothetical protein C0Q70_04563 [Pomacea canaliculata]|uniref:Phosphatidylserine synthase n=1 Tax=Pomacea canaliculata TaxID=400727 RepID=A0A2T7PIU9_POMCA|nr:hypothetical protein C0Q70_04563 [Pomacea canaliculata]
MASARREEEMRHTDLLRMHSATAHDWEGEKRNKKDFYDDGTMSFFWRAHTITALVIFSGFLVYVAVVEEGVTDRDYNAKSAMKAHVTDSAVLSLCAALWRLVLCLSIVYELALVFLLFQTVDDARQLMKHFDDKLGKPLPEKDYGGNCFIYDSNHTNPWHNLEDKVDEFVPTHFFGWWLKTLILRDWWLCTILSIMFEVLEYTLEHQLPNFSECWWDHWIMDAIVCNGLGIYLGMKTLNYLSMKPYHWRGMWNIPTYGGKLKRLAAQFTPYSWTDFDWKPTSSLKRWMAMLAVIAIFLLAELNTFYLKFVLWIPPKHYLCVSRLVFFSLWELQLCGKHSSIWMTRHNCKKVGRQSWLIAAIIITEFLIVLKFDWETVTKPIPQPVASVWGVGLLCLVVWTIFKFYILRDVKHDVPSPVEGNSSKHFSEATKSSSVSGMQLRSRSFKSHILNNNH